MASIIRSSTRTLASTSRMTQRAFHTSRPVKEHFINVDVAGFQKRVLDESVAKPILVDFYASWCQPCKVLTPILQSVTGPDSGYDLMTVNVDDHPELAGQYKVSALPTVVAFKNGKLVNKFVGFKPEGEVRKFLGLL